MVDIPDHLVPTDGLTRSKVRFAGLDLFENGQQCVRFDIYREDQSPIGTFAIDVRNIPNGNADTVIADGHAKMRDVLRQWLYEVDKLEQLYRKQSESRITR